MPCVTCDVSSPTGDLTFIPCVGRQILNHWSTRDIRIRCKYQSSHLLTWNSLSISSLLPSPFATKRLFSVSVRPLLAGVFVRFPPPCFIFCHCLFTCLSLYPSCTPLLSISLPLLVSLSLPLFVAVFLFLPPSFLVFVSLLLLSVSL